MKKEYLGFNLTSQQKHELASAATRVAVHMEDEAFSRMTLPADQPMLIAVANSWRRFAIEITS